MTKTDAFDFNTFDLGNRKQEEGTTLRLRHPATNLPLGPTLKVASYESERSRAATRAVTERRAREQRATSTPEESDADQLEVLLGVIVSWEGIRVDGKELEFTPENVRSFLRRYKFVRDQVDQHAASRAPFFGV